MKKNIIIMLTVLSAAGMFAACQNALTEAIGDEETSEEIVVIESEEAATETYAETGVVTVERYPASGEEGETDGDIYIEADPVRKWGYFVERDGDGSRLYFNSNEYYVDESGDTKDAVSEIVLNIGTSTEILDASTLMSISVEDIDTSMAAYVWTSQAMTMSLPPQISAQVIIANVPADSAAPQYVVVKAVSTEDGVTVIKDQDGTEWTADDTTEVIPHSTKNIVTLSDISEGSRIVIVPAEDGDANKAAKILVFAGNISDYE